MRKTLILRIVATVLTFLIAGGVITLAWYINTRKTEPVEIVTNGTTISYRINSSTEQNLESYDVENISFFDINATNEAYYLPSMAVNLKFSIANYSTTAVNVKLSQDTQEYRLGTAVDNGVVSVYKYEAATVTSQTFTENTHFTYNNSTFAYTAPNAFVTGEKYYTRSLLFTATPTITSSKVTSVVLGSVPAGKEYLTTIDNGGLGFAVEEYAAAGAITEDDFNLTGAVYYTLANSTYTQARTYDNSATYYEKKTVAYLSDFTIASSKITNVAYSVTGSYVTCAIADSSKLVYKDNKYSLPSVTNANRYSTNVNSYLSTNAISHSYITSTKLAAGSLNTAGGSIDVCVFIYGVQPYKGATNNFLNNSQNLYPIKLIIEAE